ncbi:MAG: hypothetical protein J0I34_18670 [Pseudonocardia sp.]|uniref:Zn-ribbon domain-containing OB-fold protein n=1 Tax=unclassified Pseudonocardia TaxID=2619320 RepID=UPI00086DFF7A|nr:MULTISPECIES: zinc ribbon domain-containing protein [unclassified Pseudonocardia]MBN9110790.1 hypothetical protein [Pseudonocardia sp.]ODU27157.1 MAG: hypothetical protein ABS80_04805 [Pseudonocardia sp. SCN 72-51]ODV04480.1 MAG: hypothetical protein ABT15_21195 [Pseudonocardia sp. SCN 73-27]
MSTASLVARHVDALLAGRLLAHRCSECRQITFPMTTACTGCGSFHHEEISLTGRGLLLFATHAGAPPAGPHPAETAPHVYCHVLLDEGVPVHAILLDVAATPEAMADLYERRNVIVDVAVPATADPLPLPAFRLRRPGRY